MKTVSKVKSTVGMSMNIAETTFVPKKITVAIQPLRGIKELKEDLFVLRNIKYEKTYIKQPSINVPVPH